MGKFATGVTVISYVVEGRPAGLTANAFASVSLDPPLVLVSIRNTSRFLQALSLGGRYGINFLACDQHHLSDQFGGRPRAALPTPFRICEGVPLIEGCLASVVVKVVDFYPAGDHKLVVGRVESLRDQPGAPLVYFGGAYRELSPVWANG